MARYGVVPRNVIVNAVIFEGTPSQVVNLPAFMKGVVVVIAVFVGYAYATTRWPVPWLLPALAVAVVLGGVGLAYLQVKFTEFVIDAERITCRKGILSRTVQSVELFRIQDVRSIHPWWQRLFGIGAVIVLTSDSNNPVWRLPGMKDAEQLRYELNRAALDLRDTKGVREVNTGRI